MIIAVSLLYFLFRDWDMKDMISRFKNVRYSWVFLSIFLSIISHILRAYRWNLMLKPLGYKNLRTYRTFMAVMIGYLANLVAPRLGELTRCGVLKRVDNVNMSASIGSVVAERIFDFLGLLTIVFTGLALEFDRLSSFFIDFFNERSDKIDLTHERFFALVLVGLILAILAYSLWWYWERIKRKPFYFKLRSFFREMSDGLTSIKKLENRRGFWLSTIFIWLLYYLMAYVIFFATESTENLGLMAGLSILIMGGLGMSAPVQGGFGTYHFLVSAVLLTYGVSEKDGLFFATLVHTSQTLSVMFFGGLSFILTLPYRHRNKEIKE